MVDASHPEAFAEGSSQANQGNRPIYEVGFHVVPTADDVEVARTVETIRGYLGAHNAEIIMEQFPQKIALAYAIERAVHGRREKYGHAYFGAIKFALNREHIAGLEALLRGSKELIRYLLIETVREEPVVSRRAVFASNRLEGETIKKPASAPEVPGEVSEEELEKSIDALVS